MTDPLSTPHLQLSQLAPAQALKHITVNEALNRLDSIIAVFVLSRTTQSPPSSGEGDRFLVPENATDAWDGMDNDIAEWRGGDWYFTKPDAGWTAFVADESRLVIFDGTEWITQASAQSITTTAVGVNSSADLQNRLTVKSDAVLFSHDDQTPGNGDMRLALNKSELSTTASLILQSDFSGRAEIGLAGEDALSVKVSPDGSNFAQALYVDPTTARVEFPQTPPIVSPFNLLPDAGRFAGSPEPNSTSAPTFSNPTYISPFNGGTFTQGPKFIHDNGSYGGPKDPLDPLVDELISKIKTSTGVRRFGPEFFTLSVTAGTGTGGHLDVDTISHYLALTNLAAPVPSVTSWNFHVRVISESVAISAHSNSRTLKDGVEESGAFRIVAAEGWAQVTHLYNVPTEVDLGYNTVLLRIYATPGSEFLLAAPTFTPGHIPSAAGRYYLVTPSLEAWR